MFLDFSFLFRKMSIRVLCIGDPHFTEDSYLEMEQFSNKTSGLIDKLKSEPEGLSLVVVLGDILDRFGHAHLTIHTQAMKWLYQISLRTQLLILIGNHDRINNKVFLTEDSFFWACHHWTNVTVADTTKEITINGFRFIAVPYVAPGRFSEALSLVKDWQSATAIFAHQEMKGCSLGIIKSELGDPWSNDYPLLISGHIHEYERLGNNIVYVGTPRMKTFGDHKEKTISLFTFDKVSINWKEERLSLELPKKISVRLTVSQITTATDFLSLSGNLTGTLKIFIQGTSSELSIGLKHPIVKHLKSLGVKIVPEEITQESKANLADLKFEEIETISRTELQKKIWDRLAECPELLNVMKSLFGTIKLKI